MAGKEPSTGSLLMGKVWLAFSIFGLAACLALGWHLCWDPALLHRSGPGVALALLLCVAFGIPACAYGIVASFLLGQRERRLRFCARTLSNTRAHVAELEDSHVRQRDRIDELATLREVAYVVNRESDFAIIAEKVLELLAAILEPLEACIFVTDETDATLKPFAHFDGRKVRTGSRVRAEDMYGLHPEEFEHRSVLCEVSERQFHATVPLKVGQETLGALLVVFAQSGRSKQDLLSEFNAGRRNFLLEISQHISLAVKTKHMQMQMVMDGLTRLYTKSHFAVELESLANFAHRHKEPFSLLLLDIDHFKSVNDTYGHSAGDEVLSGVADTLRACLRKYDSGYRTGGEEMAILLPRTNVEQAAKIAERLRKRIEKEAFAIADGQRISVTVSCGVAQYRIAEPPEHLFNRCDKSLYAAKQGGRNRIVTEGG